MTRAPLPVEIAVQDAAGVRIALEAGAARIELCQALGLGGLTPSAGLIEAAVDQAQQAAAERFVHVLVRPRGGGFVYDEEERSVIERDIRAARALGAHGVVVGALTERGELDADAIARFVEAADGIDVTVHRVVDAAADPAAAVRAAQAAGARRVLTSGGAQDCRAGLDRLAEFVEETTDLEIMAGGGVRIADIAELISAGVHAVHLSARGTTSRGGASGPGGGVDGFDITDPGLVRAAVAAAAATPRGGATGR
ncbi:copper homeostasis protein CutC [Agromyces sp. G08B096]|uniref:PF03932 family protein CutC n=1 Tax=Agromyces sp. G08B096 TaxID=3156399 RepID=A0AAU7WD01_9MICO